MIGENMRIVNCGYEYRHPEAFHINRPKGSGDNIILVVRSRAYFTFNGKKELVDPNTVVLFKQGDPQIYGAYDGEYVNDWVHFEAKSEELEYLSGLGIQFGMSIALRDVSPLSKLILNMFSEMYSQNKNSEASAQAYLHLLLYKISDLCAEKAESFVGLHPEIQKGLEKLRNEMFLFPEREWTVEQASKKVSISQSYFQHKYKSRFGVSFISDLNAARMERAKYLLVSTEYTVVTISELCGYHSGEHFMRAFKILFGATPTEYREVYASSDDKLRAAKWLPPFTLRSST